MATLKDRLKEIFIRDKLITEEDLEKALSIQKRNGGELSKILIEMRVIDEDTLTQVLSEGLGIPPINISRMKIDPQVIKKIPKNVALKYRVMPISLIGENLTLAMADPLNIFAVDNVKILTGYTINPIITRPRDIDEAINRYYKEEGVEEENVEKLRDIIKDIQSKDEEDIEFIKEGQDDKRTVEELKDEAPIIRLVDTILQQAVIAKASDVFVEPLEKSMRVRYRIDGIIREIDRMAKMLSFPVVSRVKVIANLDISEHRLPQDGRFKIMVSGNREVDFRVSVLPTAMGEKIVLRILDQDSSVANIENLGFEADSLKRLKECAIRPHGMILTCGPTGSGKTTTLYSILKFVNSPGKNIVTVEDPVEFQMRGINQVNVRPQVGLTFATSLRSILRQDPDIILIGEIRDSETMDIAVKAALTGHLVLSSLHTTTAAGSIVRMMNMGVEPFLICSSVLAIVAQRLVRRICPHCKEKYELQTEVAKKVGLIGLAKEKRKSYELFRGKGCPKCLNLGYKGRVGITEVLILSLTLKELILNRVSESQIKEQARKEGMITMREDGLLKALQGQTSLEEVLRVTAPDEQNEKEQ